MTVLFGIATIAVTLALTVQRLRDQSVARGECILVAGLGLFAVVAGAAGQDSALAAGGALLTALAGYLYGRGIQQESAAAGAAADLFKAVTATVEGLPAEPHTMLVEVDEIPGVLAGCHVYRALPDPVAQQAGHARGLIVFVDEALDAIDRAQTAAYADGHADQVEEQRRADDPEQVDAAVACTNLDATWCPVCGRCSCDVDPDAPEDEPYRTLDPDCQLHGIYSDHAGQDPVLDDDPEPDPEPVEDDNLRECWSCTADRPATDDPCLYCQTPASRWTRGEQVTGHRHQLPGRHGQVGVVDWVGHAPNGQPFYHVRWPDSSGRGTLADGPYGQRELADLDTDQESHE